MSTQTAVRQEARRATEQTSHGAGLEVEELSHRFGERLVVDRVSFAVPPGEVHCLVGPSGCGKTTTLRLIAGLERLQAGLIRINGREVAAAGLSVPPERRHVGLMFQDFALFPHLRVDENVAFGLSGQDRRSRDARVAELLRRVNMSRHARSYPHTLSGGEQQRVALARALAPAPELMLLDEAFSALDTTLRAQVREEALGLLRETGTPTLLVTHDAEEAIRVGDRIHAMQDGRIVQSGTPAELYSRPRDLFVAGFFGPVNRFRLPVRGGAISTPVGEVPAEGCAEGGEVDVVLRPEALRLHAAGSYGGLRAKVLSRRDLGPVHLIWLGLPDGTTVKVRQGGAIAAMAGEEVDIELDRAHLFLYPGDK
ncbi:ABC transporter ATP-binding protein [Geminicoccaceae bacterium 1502E]|nr:ABC transporter ATP-binding protein [Geminicoccaceae bacterium 1502E]